MFHYPTAPSVFVDPYDPYAPHHQPFYAAGPSRLSQAQRQRELYHEQRRRALAMEAQRRERQRLAYEQHLREQEWARRMNYSSFWDPRQKDHYVHHDDDGDEREDEYDSAEESESEPEPEPEQAQGFSTRQAHISQEVSSSKRPISPKRCGISIPIPEPASYGPTEEDAATTLQKHFRARLYRRQALAALKALADTYAQRSKVEIPTKLHAYNGKLAYDSHNAPFHAYEDALVKLLTQLDEISTKGDDKIKAARKALVRKIEKELNRLDQIKETSLAQVALLAPSLEAEDSGDQDAGSEGEQIAGAEDEEEWHGIPSDTESEAESTGDIEPLV
ncbi:BZ3500_MvSof-1268-A1-R1_Chr3-1g05877 [Microbotryum saponariae]|uniref:BZ3500_MvSof-1268-A1-R1_Chr3-1g05877 protein n=1 Tax=Microbotryum saponariae TaxID=289078 RepID=A0A2X0NIJ6_9BASI|nr:BZ3500_MvSof-1268-A1-R1_Chr3-1g05877 [Microbotryum saponariae]SDA05067.1 BZ3501_MvSof-1269-A2-R1_Chr3-1g05547 [Microbotryum saponariae]